MCLPTQGPKVTSVNNPFKIRKNESSLRNFSVWPLHPLGLLVIFLYLPTSSYINRGYTVWFHLITISYLLTKVEFLRRFLIVQGLGITFGWYAAICNDYFIHSRFFNILYMNMPEIIVSALTDSDGKILYTTEVIPLKLLSNLLDILLHPGIVYLLYKAHCKSSATPNKDLFSWPVIISTFTMSRFWSVFHTYYNSGNFSLFYIGTDIYILDEMDSWFAAYFAEISFFVALVGYKLVCYCRGQTCDTN